MSNTLRDLREQYEANEAVLEQSGPRFDAERWYSLQWRWRKALIGKTAFAYRVSERERALADLRDESWFYGLRDLVAALDERGVRIPKALTSFRDTPAKFARQQANWIMARDRGEDVGRHPQEPFDGYPPGLRISVPRRLFDRRHLALLREAEARLRSDVDTLNDHTYEYESVIEQQEVLEANRKALRSWSIDQTSKLGPQEHLLVKQEQRRAEVCQQAEYREDVAIYVQQRLRCTDVRSTQKAELRRAVAVYHDRWAKPEQTVAQLFDTAPLTAKQGRERAGIEATFAALNGSPRTTDVLVTSAHTHFIDFANAGWSENPPAPWVDGHGLAEEWENAMAQYEAWQVARSLRAQEDAGKRVLPVSIVPLTESPATRYSPNFLDPDDPYIRVAIELLGDADDKLLRSVTDGPRLLPKSKPRAERAIARTTPAGRAETAQAMQSLALSPAFTSSGP